MALLKCNRNYIANGSVTAFCESNSQWNRKIGKCVSLESGKPCPQIEFFRGVIHYITPYTTNEVPQTMHVSGTRAVFICDPDFALRGESQSLCFDGKWSTEPPRCVIILAVYFPVNSKYCEAIKVNNSRVVYSGAATDDSKYNLNTIAVVKCDPKHVYSGSPQHVCMGYDKWSGHLGLCIEN
uniref:Sushi domain-containing protein n=2 Tax=Wuchereria bancrofti TaxID=6293 RepID=A0AAF5Q329_WUCBA